MITQTGKTILEISWILFAFFIQSGLFAQQPISEIKSLPLGSQVTTSGIITSGPEFGTIRYMQDESAGIAIYSSSLSDRIVGDSIIITGILSLFKGQLQISPVLSHQVMATSVSIPSPVEIDLGDPGIISFESMRVNISCMGISTCESRFDENVFTIFDDNGVAIRMNLAEDDSLIGQLIPPDPISITGILTFRDSLFQLLCQSITNPDMDCKVIDAADIDFSDFGYATLVWQVTGNGDYQIEYGLSEFNNSEFIIPHEGKAEYTFTDSLLQASIYKARLFESSIQGSGYSIPVYFSLKDPGPVNHEVFFNRGVNTAFSDGSYANGAGTSAISTDIISRIDDVDSTLDIAMYNATNDVIIAAVIRAAQRGVHVRYITDDETSNSALDGVFQFPILYRSGDGIMHNKFIIGDADSNENAWLWTGSTNFSGTQLSSDPNHAIVFHHKVMAQNYKSEFDELWGAGPNHTGSRAGELKSDNTCHEFQFGVTYIESYFSPSDETNCHIIEALRTADHHIEVGLLLLTKEDIVDELINLHQDGIDIRLIVDDEESSSNALSRLQQAGIQTAIHDLSPIFHHKYAILDEGFPDSDPMVITGSHNWTFSADNINDENTLIVHDQSFANIFRQEFEARWGELSTTSVNGELTADGINLYPNPASGFIILSNPGNQLCAVDILNLNGTIISSFELVPNEIFRMDIGDNIQDGMYIVHWRWGNANAATRMVIQKR